MNNCAVNSDANSTRVSKTAPENATEQLEQLEQIAELCNKFRRYRLRKIRREYQNSGEAFLHTECLMCSKPIKPSYRRGFCPGGVCRDRYLNAKPVHRVVPITRLDRAVSTRIATQYFLPEAVQKENER
jgi:hypothetical protein